MAGGMTRWNPLQDLAAIQHEMDRLWTGFGMPTRSSQEGEMGSVTMPSIDIVSRGDDMVIRADIPGAKPSDVDITVTDSMLSIKANREESHETKEHDYVVRERSWGSYERTVRLPRGVDPNAIHADFHDGVLDIVVPGGAMVNERGAVHVPIGGSMQQRQMQGGSQAQSSMGAQQTMQQPQQHLQSAQTAGAQPGWQSGQPSSWQSQGQRSGWEEQQRQAQPTQQQPSQQQPMQSGQPQQSAQQSQQQSGRVGEGTPLREEDGWLRPDPGQGQGQQR